MLYTFVANFIRFPAVQNFEHRLRFDKVTDSYKVGTFLRHSVDRIDRRIISFLPSPPPISFLLSPSFVHFASLSIVFLHAFPFSFPLILKENLRG